MESGVARRIGGVTTEPPLTAPHRVGNALKRDRKFSFDLQHRSRPVSRAVRGSRVSGDVAAARPSGVYSAPLTTVLSHSGGVR